MQKLFSQNLRHRVEISASSFPFLKNWEFSQKPPYFLIWFTGAKKLQIIFFFEFLTYVYHSLFFPTFLNFSLFLKNLQEGYPLRCLLIFEKFKVFQKMIFNVSVTSKLHLKRFSIKKYLNFVPKGFTFKFVCKFLIETNFSQISTEK